jgi:hypothetical protein
VGGVGWRGAAPGCSSCPGSFHVTAATAGASANLYYECVHGSDWPTPSQVPTGVAVFAEDISIRRYAEQGNNIIHWSDFEAGGHFAALEVPDLLVTDLRTFFRSLSASNEPSQSR